MKRRPLDLPAGKKVRLEITPLSSCTPLPGRVCGVPTAQATPHQTSRLIDGFVRPAALSVADASRGEASPEELLALESQMRELAVAGSEFLLLRLNAAPAIELSSRVRVPLASPSFPTTRSSGVVNIDAITGGGILGGGIYQLMKFPIARFNGIPLPLDSSIRFANPSRWLSGGMESRLFTITVEGTTKYFSWDAHAPVGKTPHDFFHVNQKGMFSVFNQADHASLPASALVQAKQLRYLKLGGRIFLIVGVVVDGIQLGAAAKKSYDEGSARPIAAQVVRTAGTWAAAWAGAKAGFVVGGVAGVETGPGLVLTAIGGGIVGGFAGYLGADWIADWIYED